MRQIYLKKYVVVDNTDLKTKQKSLGTTKINILIINISTVAKLKHIPNHKKQLACGSGSGINLKMREVHFVTAVQKCYSFKYLFSSS